MVRQRQRRLPLANNAKTVLQFGGDENGEVGTNGKVPLRLPFVARHDNSEDPHTAASSMGDVRRFVVCAVPRRPKKSRQTFSCFSINMGQ